MTVIYSRLHDRKPSFTDIEIIELIERIEQLRLELYSIQQELDSIRQEIERTVQQNVIPDWLVDTCIISMTLYSMALFICVVTGIAYPLYFISCLCITVLRFYAFDKYFRKS